MLKNKKKAIKIETIIGAVAVLAVLVCSVYLNDFYHADMEAIEMFETENQVEVTEDREGNLVFGGEDAEKGFIFYPGGKVESAAYIPLMEQLAAEGILCVLVKMPFHLAVLDMNAADGIQEQYPQITSVEQIEKTAEIIISNL